MKKLLISLGFIAGLVVLTALNWSTIRGLKPVLLPPPEDITKQIPESDGKPESVNETGPLRLDEGEARIPLKLPTGFSISIFAKNLPGARVMKFDKLGNLWVSRTGEGTVTLLEIENGKVKSQSDIFRNLRKPHGLAFDPKDSQILYIAEEHRVRRFRIYTEDEGETVLDLPYGEGHFTRTIAFGPDNKLYASVGSSCNVCVESDSRRATIIRYDPETKKSEIFAKGLRNAVFFTWDYVRRKMWATDMGRDWLGDNTPPDEINIIEGGKNYGWPICYGKNIHDTDFDKNVYIRNPCEGPFETSSYIDIPAHSAPLGLAFIPEDPPSREASDGQGGWPEDYWYNLLVAYHGSWNKSKPTGYKVVRYKLDANGKYLGEEDFISGWLTPKNEALGRPVDILVMPGGTALVSDDKAGVIYRISLSGKK